MRAYLYNFTTDDDKYYLPNYEGVINNSDQQRSITITLSRKLTDLYKWKELYYETNSSFPFTYQVSNDGIMYSDPKTIQKETIREFNTCFRKDVIITEYDIEEIISILDEYKYYKGNQEEVEYRYFDKNRIYLFKELDNRNTPHIIEYMPKEIVLNEEKQFLKFTFDLMPGEYVKNLEIEWDPKYHIVNEKRSFSYFTRN